MDRGRSVGCFRGVDGRTNIGSSATNCYTTLSYKFTRSILGIDSQNLKLDVGWLEIFLREEGLIFVTNSIHHESRNLLNINPVTAKVYSSDLVKLSDKLGSCLALLLIKHSLKSLLSLCWPNGQLDRLQKRGDNQSQRVILQLRPDKNKTSHNSHSAAMTHKIQSSFNFKL